MEKSFTIGIRFQFSSLQAQVIPPSYQGHQLSQLLFYNIFSLIGYEPNLLLTTTWILIWYHMLIAYNYGSYVNSTNTYIQNQINDTYSHNLLSVNFKASVTRTGKGEPNDSTT